MVSEGEIVVAELPQSDGDVKLRPVLLLRKLPSFGDYLSCGISTQLHQAESGFDVILDKSHAHFGATGLRASSVVRLSFLASVPVNRLKRRLGKISVDHLGVLQSNLANHLVARQQPEDVEGSL
jgi:mRNA interferase MazF